MGVCMENHDGFVSFSFVCGGAFSVGTFMCHVSVLVHPARADTLAAVREAVSV